MVTRRSFLKTAAASAASAGGLGARAFAQSATAPPPPSQLRALPASVRLLPPEYPETRVWSYGGGFPGHPLRFAQGARVRQRLVNGLPDATSIHWHGIRIDNAMDGVAGLTQKAVAPGDGFDYDFDLPDAGTYWYHAHTRSYEQVARGLYGALIVDEPEPPEVDRDEVLVLDDWRVNPEDGQIDLALEASHDRSHAGRMGNYITTNGRFDFSLDVKRGERLRLRLINTANANIFVLALAGLDGWMMALDGMPLARPEPVPETLALAPAQRVDLIVDVVAEPGESAWLVRLDGDKGVAQAAFPVTGTASAARRAGAVALAPNPRMELPGLAGARRVRLNMEGGAMGRMQAAVLNGKRKSFRDLAGENQFWAFNGVVGRTETPLAEIALGETVRIEIVNDTAFPHAMHLHGMHFREIGDDDVPGPMRDTVLIYSGQTREIAFVADNPGDWLFHCHMLAHAAAGMTTWLRVT